MAFTQTNAQREITSRKILEDLKVTKQLLLKQGAIPNLTSAPSILPLVSGPVGTSPNLLAETHTTSAQRSALYSAHSQSFGFFVTQDSSFGNLIVPVIPRFDNK